MTKGNNKIEIESILRKRADLLKVLPEKPAFAPLQFDGLEFLLDDEHYILESAYIAEVQYLQAITPLPCTPAFIEGITYLRGKIMAIVNLKRLFGLSEKAITNHNRVIYLRHAGVELGILADEVLGNVMVNPEVLQKEVAGIAGLRTNVIMGISQEKKIVLNAIAILSSQDIIVNEEV